jgi:putative phosphoribosyl transferase
MADRREIAVDIPAGEVELAGDLAVPADTRGLVVFAHGSGSSRFSPRNRSVAQALRNRGLGTLLMDLLTPEEEEVDARTGQLRFDIELLSDRLVAAVDWATARAELGGIPLGLFGASTGTAAALSAAASRPDVVKAVVSRGGRPDLATVDLASVRAPTLLIVGGADHPVVKMNREAGERLGGEHRLEIVTEATHLFEEPGALEEVARLAGDWFIDHLGS